MMSRESPVACQTYVPNKGSRICVKNLPKYVGEDRLREFFSQKGEVTDAKIMRTRDGKSRQFAFVGFKTEQEADEALRFFNHSYLDTFKIICEVARKVGDLDIPRPWSKHSQKKADLAGGKFGGDKAIKAENINLSPNKFSIAGNTYNGITNSDPQLQEFLSVMQSRSKSKLWANDTLGVSSVGPSSELDQGVLFSSKEEKVVNDSLTNDGRKLSKEMRDVSDSYGYEGQTEVNNEDISDMEYFRSKVKKSFSDAESDEDDTEIKTTNDEPLSSMDKTETHKVAQVSDHTKSTLDGQNEDKVHKEINSSSVNDSEQEIDSGRLFVRNLPYTTSENELRELFSMFGEVDDAHLVVDKETKQSKGIGYVLYKLPESAVGALRELDNSIFQGRLLHVMPAKPSSKSDAASEKKFKSFKQKREDSKKASEVGGDTKSWNSLFMRSDTVVENIARKYGVSKSDLLDRDADDLAVRIALGETQVIAETKRTLATAGVNVNALEKYTSKQVNTGRSSEVILVKNLPFNSSEGDLAVMFGKYGSIDKVILPPTKVLALVVFLEPTEARAAFKGLAYKRYRDAPLYLEWAPSDILLPNTLVSDEQKSTVDGQNIKRLLDQTVDGVPDTDLDPDRTESRTLFIKNLNFKTSDEVLKKHFSDSIRNGEVRSAMIKKHVKYGKNVSMGYGFVEFDSLETTAAVCRDLQGTILDGHALTLQPCHTKREGSSMKKNDKESSSTKLIVRNVAFEATVKDIKQLFSPFGQLKSVRLPMKLGGHRGFAFVEYVTKQEAKNALQALSSTHLYGRHLVLEPAREGESLEELRARTASQFLDSTEGYQKISKKRKLMVAADDSKHKFESAIE